MFMKKCQENIEIDCKYPFSSNETATMNNCKTTLLNIRLVNSLLLAFQSVFFNSLFKAIIWQPHKVLFVFSQMFANGITSFLIFRDDYFNCTKKQGTERCECVANVAKKKDQIKSCNAASKNVFQYFKNISKFNKARFSKVLILLKESGAWSFKRLINDSLNTYGLVVKNVFINI